MMSLVLFCEKLICKPEAKNVSGIVFGRKKLKL
jgi:hypothetical protein